MWWWWDVREAWCAHWWNRHHVTSSGKFKLLEQFQPNEWKLTLEVVAAQTAASCDDSWESFAELERRRTTDEDDRCD